MISPLTSASGSFAVVSAGAGGPAKRQHEEQAIQRGPDRGPQETENPAGLGGRLHATPIMAYALNRKRQCHLLRTLRWCIMNWVRSSTYKNGARRWVTNKERDWTLRTVLRALSPF